MAKVNINTLEDYYEESPVQIEKIKRKNKPSDSSKKHTKTENKRSKVKEVINE